MFWGSRSCGKRWGNKQSGARSAPVVFVFADPEVSDLNEIVFLNGNIGLQVRPALNGKQFDSEESSNQINPLNWNYSFEPTHIFASPGKFDW